MATRIFVDDSGTRKYFNGVDLPMLYNAEGDWSSPMREIQIAPETTGDGAFVQYARWRSRSFTIPVVARSSTWRTQINEMYRLLEYEVSSSHTTPRPVVLNVEPPSGSIYQLNAYLVKIDSPLMNELFGGGVLYTLRFVAHDPFFYSAVTYTQTIMTDSAMEGTAFPLAIPASFAGIAVFDSTFNISGSNTFPIITITGPVNSATIRNMTTNQYLSVLRSLGSNDILKIDLGQKKKFVLVNDARTAGYVGLDSNLADFTFVSGDNEIKTFVTAGAGSQIVFEYRERYLEAV